MAKSLSDDLGDWLDYWLSYWLDYWIGSQNCQTGAELTHLHLAAEFAVIHPGSLICKLP